MVGFSLSFALGVWLLQQQAALPDIRWAGLLFVLPVAVYLPQHHSWQRIFRTALILTLAVAAGFLYAAGMAQHRLADEMPATWQGRDITIIGVVAEMPRLHERGQGFVFDVESVITAEAKVPQHILLSTYPNGHGKDSTPKNKTSHARFPNPRSALPNPPPKGERTNASLREFRVNADTPLLMLHAGERWQLTVRLKQPHGTSNPYSFDFEAWALERNLRAVGYVHNKGDNRRLDETVIAPGYFIEKIREAIRAHFQQVLGSAPYSGVLTALAIGDQASIPAAQWQVFTRTGVNHLMSISGLHITMLAGMGFACVYWLWRRNSYLTLFIPARKAAAAAGFTIALAYALLSGYGVPAQRTVYMLGTVAVALWLSRSVAPSQLLSYALMAVLLLDPWAVMAPGFWLSFGAVALIFYITAHRLGTSHWLFEYGKIQWAMSIGLIPLLLAMFQQISLVSPLANAFAIPLISFVVVPLALLGALLPFDWVLHLAHYAMSMTMLALEWLNELPVAVWTQHAPPLWSTVIGMIGVLWILLPRGFPSRWLGVILLLPMFLIQAAAPLPGSLRLTIFDVGQGLAVAVQTSNHALLYDTGPVFNSEANSGNRILVPSMKGMGIAKLDKLMLSHNDSDHTGGALSVMQAMPVAMLFSSLPDDSPILLKAAQSQRCFDTQSWDWDGVHFELLHPSLLSIDNGKIKDNDKSCVLRISTGQHSVLLTADIEKNSERRLLELHPDKLNATMLIVPHHGSKTSSTPKFVAAVRPRYAVFTAGYRNSYDHPKEEVIKRYRAVGSELLRSDEDGAILVQMDAQNFSVERYRLTHARYWQQ